MSAIYLVQSLANGKNYVGQTRRSGVQARYRNLTSPHLCNGRKGHRSIDNAIRKYGAKSFSFVDVMKDVPLDQLDGWERFWIKLTGTTDRRLGYNLDDGGKSGRMVCSESRKRMSDAAKRNPTYQNGLAKMILRSKERSAAGIPGHKWKPEDRAKWIAANSKWFRTAVWTHPDHGSYTCTAPELARLFPEQKLHANYLRKIIHGLDGRQYHKGWMAFEKT